MTLPSDPTPPGPHWRIPFASPDLPDPRSLLPDIEAILTSGMLTKGCQVARFEDDARRVLGVDHVVAMSSCTTALALTLRCLSVAVERRLSGCCGCDRCTVPRSRVRVGDDHRDEVVLPSFIFLAAPAAVVWAGLKPIFVDVDPDDFTIHPEAVEAAITPRTAAILACHTFGCPCDLDALERISAGSGVPLVVDAAHGLGAKHRGTQVGRQGFAQVFSLSPTKLVVAGEGGLVATSCRCLADLLRRGREYGNDGAYGCELAGLNARLPEISALIGRASLARLDVVAQRRQDAAQAYRDALADVAGLGMQRIRDSDESSWKDFSITIDPQACGLSRDDLRLALAARGIDTRAYYAPPCHRMQAFRDAAQPGLPTTDRLAATSLSLPMGAHVTPDVARGIARDVRAAMPTAAGATSHT
ncbi:MAG: DegT/DnrJ/EryC1/StrS family aminotransferase [Actinomycetota bacterium]